MLKRAQSAVPAIPALSMARAQSLAEQAANAIVAGISAGALRPGERIIETELASLLNMSRVPLREALKILEAQGILESFPHRGTRVATFDDVRVNQICLARIALERLALVDAASICKRDPAVLARLDQIIIDMERSAERLEWIEVSKADLSFHREICRLSGNAIVATLWEALARHVFIVFGHEIRDERDAKIMGPQHRRLRDLLAKGDVEKLQREIENHILRLRRQRPDAVRASR
ncbi:GntR family transcriptional regulator [Aestuariivirga sp.]|jgi:DNA-binding GntR family transcriptional regulator|uniref:GntR family transcriptional regulator n=1 Tax=Aestuariivirga sp. TaxID=2650926 RepID=UPI003784104E